MRAGRRSRQRCGGGPDGRQDFLLESGDGALAQLRQHREVVEKVARLDDISVCCINRGRDGTYHAKHSIQEAQSEASDD